MTPRLVPLLLVLALLPAWAQELPPPETREIPRPPGAEEERDEDWELLEQIVAWVNDDIITLSDLEQAERDISRELMRTMAGPELDEALAKAREGLLYTLIERRLLVQQAEQMYDMAKLRDSLLSQFKKQQGVTSEEEMNQLLRQAGMTQDELVDLLVSNSTPGWIVQSEITDQLSVSDAEVEAYFEEHRDELGEPARVTFREIAVATGDGDESEARVRAEKAVADARSGIDFEELVRAFSDSQSKERGGLIGPAARSELAEWLVGPAFALEPGTVSDPIRTPFGWHVIRVEERTEGREAELETVRNEIENRIRQEKFQPKFEEFLSGIWNRSEIFVADGYVERLPDRWRGRVLSRQ